MRVRVTAGEFAKHRADVGVCFAREEDREPLGVGDRALRAELRARIRAEGFEGRPGDRVVWNVVREGTSRRFLLLGLGKNGRRPGEAVRGGCARAAREAAGFSARSLAVQLPPAGADGAGEECRAAVEGVRLGAYRFERHLTEPARRSVALASVALHANGPGSLRQGAALGDLIGEAVCLARDLVNEGPSRMTPSAVALKARQVARSSGLEVRVLGPPQLRKLGMHALLSVARGSAEPPRVAHLVYRPEKKPSRRVVLIGKGVTFDSGGMNLKPTDAMRTMKGDMAGAAAVLGALSVLGRVGCRAEVHGILGLTENMTGAGAYKPGDILDTYAGKSVEVGNTDAEGRLVMCDLLAWAAKKIRPDRMIDVATLTGACVVALGLQASGVFSRDEALQREVLDAGGRAGEKLWPLPMYEEYLPLLQKGPADLCNVGGRWGGAITAALFLGEFVPRDLPWLHLDIAGPAFADAETPESPEGGTGAGVRTLVRWLETQ